MTFYCQSDAYEIFDCGNYVVEFRAAGCTVQGRAFAEFTGDEIVIATIGAVEPILAVRVRCTLTVYCTIGNVTGFVAVDLDATQVEQSGLVEINAALSVFLPQTAQNQHLSHDPRLMQAFGERLFALMEIAPSVFHNLGKIVLFHGVFSFRCTVLFYGLIIQRYSKNVKRKREIFLKIFESRDRAAPGSTPGAFDHPCG